MSNPNKRSNVVPLVKELRIATEKRSIYKDIKHGTFSGYHALCRCVHCVEHNSMYHKVRRLTTDIKEILEQQRKEGIQLEP